MTSEPNVSTTFSMDEFENALHEYDYNFERGQVVTGKIFEHTSDGVFVDIGGKSPGFVPTREALLPGEGAIADILPLGQETEFLIIRDQNAEGQVTLSRRQLEEKRVWEELEQAAEAGTSVQIRVSGSNRGGITGEVKGLRGFVPNSHLIDKDLDSIMGQMLTVNFLELDKERRKLVLSQRYAAQAEVIRKFSIGSLVTGKVANIKPYGIFVELEGMTGLLHRSQISEKPIPHLEDVFKVGQELRVLIIEIEEGSKRISLCLKALEKFPGEVLEKFDELQADADARVEGALKSLNIIPV